MKKSTFLTAFLAALAGAFPVHAQSVHSPVKAAALTKPATPKLSMAQRAIQKKVSQANFAAMSRQEKAANKGNQQRPTKPAEPATHKSHN